MDIANTDLTGLLPKLEARRNELKMSYQNVADACNVSQSTIIRFFKNENEPTLELVQKVIAALSFETIQQPVAPREATLDALNEYLKESVLYERESKRIILSQQEARANRTRRELLRVIWCILAILFVLVGFICGLFLYDFTHLDRGWIQDIVSHARELPTTFIKNIVGVL